MIHARSPHAHRVPLSTRAAGTLLSLSTAGPPTRPGGKVHVTLTITDSRARVYGFQASSRLSSNKSNGQAGSFIAGTQQFVICEDGSDRPTSGSCRSSAPLEFIEHNRPFTTNVISFDWNAPSTNVGNVIFYVAANAANGDGQPTGDHIYTTFATLTPAASVGPKPTSARAE